MPTNSYGDYAPPADLKQLTNEQLIIELLKLKDSIHYGEVGRALSSQNLEMLVIAIVKALQK